MKQPRHTPDDNIVLITIKQPCIHNSMMVPITPVYSRKMSTCRSCAAMALVTLGLLIIILSCEMTIEEKIKILDASKIKRLIGTTLAEDRASKTKNYFGTTLADEVSKTKRHIDTRLADDSNGFLVPNIVHYVWFGKQEWKFHQMLSVKSAFLNIKPDKIFFHCDQEPVGKWWKYTKVQVPILEIVNATIPRTVFENEIKLIQHSSDVYRYQVLLHMGGIYLDTDVIVLKSFNPLRKFEFTLGLEMPFHLGNDVIISAQNASFLNIWFDTYRSFSGLEYNVHSVLVPYILSEQYPELIHVEKYTLNYPDWSTEGLDLLYNKVYDWSKNYCIHMNYRLNRINYNPSIIRTLNTTFGQIARSIYFKSATAGNSTSRKKNIKL